MPTDKPRYEVLARAGAIEVRRYAPIIVAETFVEGELGPAGSEGYRRLLSYISGYNRARREIDCPGRLLKAETGNRPAAASPPTAFVPAATTPAAAGTPAGESIPMTAPMGQRPEGAGYWVSFVMPSTLSLVTLPQPSHPQIRLRELAARTVAVIRFRGWWRPRTVKRYRQELEQWMRGAALKAAGEPVYARYNPPYVPPFMRRNEILMPLVAWPPGTVAPGDATGIEPAPASITASR
ncbi:MAG: heme-binding protein [Chromatiales bacterium]|jgi:hypothetical protein|nr:heme-binding protein [Chromatiales bacterium]